LQEKLLKFEPIPEEEKIKDTKLAISQTHKVVVLLLGGIVLLISGFSTYSVYPLEVELMSLF